MDMGMNLHAPIHNFESYDRETSITSNPFAAGQQLNRQLITTGY